MSAISRALERKRSKVNSDHLVARVDTDLLKAEADDRASVIGTCWVEKLEIVCRPAERWEEPSEDPLFELRRVIEEDILTSGAFQNELVGMAQEIRAQLPPESRDAFGADEASFREALTRLVRDGAESVMARLEPTGEGG